MKLFNKAAAAGLVGAVILASAGCANNNPGTDTSGSNSETATSEVISESTEETKSETTNAAHQVTVEAVTLKSFKDDTYEYAMVVPKLVVDGKEATEINKALSDHIQKEYPLEVDGEHADGMATKIEYGVKDNIVSIFIHAGDTGTDYFTIEVYNYDLDTLKPLDDSDIAKRLGMADDEIFSKTTELVKKYCTERDYDVEKSTASINYDKITPCILPDGNTGVLAKVAYGKGGQFEGCDTARLFNLTKMEYA